MSAASPPGLALVPRSPAPLRTYFTRACTLVGTEATARARTAYRFSRTDAAICGSGVYRGEKGCPFCGRREATSKASHASRVSSSSSVCMPALRASSRIVDASSPPWPFRESPSAGRGCVYRVGGRPAAECAGALPTANERVRSFEGSRSLHC
eukprot:6052178-Prymnesium_polylepis.1